MICIANSNKDFDRLQGTKSRMKWFFMLITFLIILLLLSLLQYCYKLFYMLTFLILAPLWYWTKAFSNWQNYESCEDFGCLMLSLVQCKWIWSILNILSVNEWQSQILELGIATIELCWLVGIIIRCIT